MFAVHTGQCGSRFDTSFPESSALCELAFLNSSLNLSANSLKGYRPSSQAVSGSFRQPRNGFTDLLQEAMFLSGRAGEGAG